MVATDIRRTVRAFPKQNWIIWVGAGVSCAAPSNLPLGLPLTQYALDQVFGRSARNRLEDIWLQANDIASAPMLPQPFGPGPRLETVLEIVEVIQTALLSGRFDFMSGLQSLIEAPFNINHLCLAQLIHDGATVVTTNFDTCIQRAYQSMLAPAMPLQGKRFGRVYRFTSDVPQSGTLWHVHGVAQDVGSLGATIRAVKQGLSPEFAKELERMFSGKALLAFAGYGAGDSFDVTPYFAHKVPGQFAGSCALFLQHGTSAVPLGACALVQPFGASCTKHGDTTAWLREMADQNIHLSSSNSSFNWKDTFFAKADLNDLAVVRPFAICRLARELGLSYEKLDEAAYHQALATVDRFERWEFHKTLAFNCRMRRKSRQERGHDREAGETDLLGYYYSKGNLRRALQLAKSLDAIRVDSSDQGVELDWSAYTSFAAHARPIIVHYLRKPVGRRLAPEDAAAGKTLLAIANRLASRPLKNVTYLNQVATAMRFSLLLGALLFGDEGQETEERVLSLYREASSIQGYVSAYRDLAIKRLLLVRLHGRRDMLDEAVLYIKKSSKLARLVGDADSARRAYTIGSIARIYNIML